MVGALGQVVRAGTCPCGTGQGYAVCCGPLHRQERLAGTAVELMRSRYSAYVMRDFDHLVRTWHPRTRPADVGADDGIVWDGLEIVRTRAGGAGGRWHAVGARVSTGFGNYSLLTYAGDEPEIVHQSAPTPRRSPQQ